MEQKLEEKESMKNEDKKEERVMEDPEKVEFLNGFVSRALGLSAGLYVGRMQRLPGGGRGMSDGKGEARAKEIALQCLKDATAYGEMEASNAGALRANAERVWWVMHQGNGGESDAVTE